MPSRSAARVMCPSSATAMKYFKCQSSMAYSSRYGFRLSHIMDQLAAKCYWMTRSSEEGDIMQVGRRQFLHLVGSAAALTLASRIAHAQQFPTRPITMVVPFPAAGPADAIARIVGERMRVSLGQPVIVENV